MVSEAGPGKFGAAAAHPLAELLECPAQAGDFLAGASELARFDAACVVFRQHERCKGLYLIVSGSLERKAQRFQTRVALGTARAGELVELAAALGDGVHTYTLTAVAESCLLLLPIETLGRAFEIYPPLRMHLLEELAREVSRAYIRCRQHRSDYRIKSRMQARARSDAGNAV
jgi:CRP-like cAMP-binding protein